jgi:hypothetical protein
MHQVVLMHEGHYTWRVRRFSNLIKEAQISPLSQRGICTNMTMLIFLTPKWTQCLASSLEHVMVVICPLLKPIVWLQLACTIDGDEMCESNCGHGVWCIKRCPPKSNCQCSALQKDTNHECEAKLISLKTTICILDPCYDSWWNNFKGDFQKSHWFWFCCDDLNYCVGSSKKKYAIDRPHVLMVWCV